MRVNKTIVNIYEEISNIDKNPSNLKTIIMAKDSSGKKFNRVPEHTRTVNGKTITIKEHIRSNRKDSKGSNK